MEILSFVILKMLLEDSEASIMDINSTLRYQKLFVSIHIINP